MSRIELPYDIKSATTYIFNKLLSSGYWDSYNEPLTLFSHILESSCVTASLDIDVIKSNQLHNLSSLLETDSNKLPAILINPNDIQSESSKDADKNQIIDKFIDHIQETDRKLLNTFNILLNSIESEKKIRQQLMDTIKSSNENSNEQEQQYKELEAKYHSLQKQVHELTKYNGYFILLILIFYFLQQPTNIIFFLTKTK